MDAKECDINCFCDKCSFRDNDEDIKPKDKFLSASHGLEHFLFKMGKRKKTNKARIEINSLLCKKICDVQQMEKELKLKVGNIIENLYLSKNTKDVPLDLARQYVERFYFIGYSLKKIKLEKTLYKTESSVITKNLHDEIIDIYINKFNDNLRMWDDRTEIFMDSITQII